MTEATTTPDATPAPAFITGPAILLFLLAPFMAELLTGSDPRVEFFTIRGFIQLTILYGGATVLVRELVVRAGKGWPTVLMLGAACGILIEGIFTRSLFDLNWHGIDRMATYGRMLGVSWVWALLVVVYHMIVSIGLPILFTSLLFPRRAGQRWLHDLGLCVLAGVWLTNGALVYHFISGYTPGPVHYVLTGAVAVVLLLLAFYLPNDLPDSGAGRISHPVRFWLAGFLFMLGIYLCGYALPYTPAPAAAALIGIPVFVLATGKLIVDRLGMGFTRSPMHVFAFGSGILSMLVVFVARRQFDPTIPNGTLGTTCAAGAAVLLMLFVGYRVWHGRRETCDVRRETQSNAARRCGRR